MLSVQNVLSASVLNDPSALYTITDGSINALAVSKYPANVYPGLVGLVMLSTVLPLANETVVVPSFASSAFLSNLTFDTLLTHAA